MIDLKRKLLAVAIGGVLSMGAFAQRRGEDKRPPKDQPRVVVQPKGEKPPPSNNNKNQGGKKDERRGRP
ncbi:MAG TPA: hypothetical protein VJU86_10820 [Pyrinomonadaceae bacterium]|nr:hypothetical protein [Pyrinomonadaceae bacterium]